MATIREREITQADLELIHHQLGTRPLDHDFVDPSPLWLSIAISTPLCLIFWLVVFKIAGVL